MLKLAPMALFGLSAAVMPMTASAQDAGVEDRGLDEVVVTARNREESLQEVPVAISVFTGEALKNAGITTARSLFVAANSNTVDGESDWVTVEEGASLGGQDAKNVLAKLVLTPTDNATLEFRDKWLDVDNEQTPRTLVNSKWWECQPGALVQPYDCSADEDDKTVVRRYLQDG